MTKQNQTVLPKVEFESILLSIKTVETYDAVIPILKQALSDKTTPERQALEAYIYLVDDQLKHNIPTQTTLMGAIQITGIDFKNQTIFPDDEVVQQAEIYSKRRSRLELAKMFNGVQEEILEHGITNHITDVCNRIASQTDVDGTYKSIGDNYLELYNKQVEFNGLSFLCPELDKRTGGMVKGTICTILGGPGSMKTTTTVNICYNAMKEGKNVAYLSLEEAPFQLYNKLMSRASVDVGKPLTVQDIVQDNLDEKDKSVLQNEVYPYFRNLPGNFYIIGEQDLGNYSLSTFESKLKEVDMLAKEETFKKTNEEDHGIDIVVVDHIQLLKFSDAYRDEFSVINTYVSFFRQQSLSFLHQKREIIVILLSQANREGIAYAQKHDGMYRIQHVAEANELERSSSYIISVYTDPMTQISKLLKMGTIKLRGSSLPLDTVNVFADGQFYQVGETAVPEQAEYNMDDLGLSSTDTSDSSGPSLDDVLGGLF